MKWISPLGEEHWDWRKICFVVFFAIAMMVAMWLVVTVT